MSPAPGPAGNNMFNTLGKLRLEPRAELLLLNFDQGTSLRLAGAAELDLDAATRTTGGTGRAWGFTAQASWQAPLGAAARTLQVSQAQAERASPASSIASPGQDSPSGKRTSPRARERRSRAWMRRAPPRPPATSGSPAK